MATAELTTSRLEELLGDDAADLLQHESTTVPKSMLHLPGPDWVDRLFIESDRNSNVLRNLSWLVNSGRLLETSCLMPVSHVKSVSEPSALRPCVCS